MKNILILCTANSARSILGEAILAKLGEGRVRAFSAGSTPRGTPNPDGIALLADYGHDTSGFRSKSWDEFDGADAPKMDIVITVCDNAAGESCPVWLGKPLTAHWGVEDPAAVEGDGQRQAFVDALSYLKRRIELFLMLPLQSIDEMSVRSKLAAIGREEGASAKAKES